MLKSSVCIDCENNAQNGSNSAVLCGNVQLIAGRCRYHYWIFRQKAAKERNLQRGIPQKTAFRLKKPQKAAKNLNKEIVNLVSWYNDRKNEFTGRCQECGAVIPYYLRHSSVAHVLPKKKDYGFPSVATHPQNAIELGPGAVCGCHTKYDNSWLSASKMKIFPLAKEKFKLIEPFIAEEERKRIPEIFLT